MNIIKTSAIALSALAFSTSAYAQNYSYNSGYNAHEACKTSEKKQKLIGGGIGAIAGAIIGSQVSGNGARTEGSAIGAVIGGLAGGGIADKRIDCDPVYASHQTQPVYSQHSQPVYSQQTYTQPTHYQRSHQPQPQKKIVYVQQSYPTTQTTHYSQPRAQYQSVPVQQYPVRTSYSDHPVYSNPSYEAQTQRVYSAPRTETFVSRPAPHTGKEYYRTSHSSHSSSQPVQHRKSLHYHGKYQCMTHH